jgi:tetratricopeptide (TPR) repeat protein
MQVGAGGRAGFVCANGYACGVSGPSTVVVNAATCNSGYPLPGNGPEYVRPDNGRTRSYDGSTVIEGETRERESDYGQIPVIYSPRNTTLLTMTPELAWVEASSASEYVLSLSGLDAFADVTLTVDELVCNDDERSAPNRICTHPWPSEWTLTAGQRYFLTINARTGIASPLRPSEPSALRTLDGEAAAQVQATASEFAAIQTDPLTPRLLLGGLYAEHQLYADAIAAYEVAVAVQPSPQSYVTLGDLYLGTDLQRFAFAAYQQALDLLATEQLDDPAVTAAAEFGIGLVYYSRANYKEAEPHFVTAVELYRQFGAEEEQLAAEYALEETRRRLS